MSKYTYTVWMEFGITVDSDKLLDPDTSADYYELIEMSKDKLLDFGINAILQEASYNDIYVEENTDGNMDS